MVCAGKGYSDEGKCVDGCILVHHTMGLMIDLTI